MDTHPQAGHPFYRFAVALNVPVPEPLPIPSDEDELADLALSEQVLAHARKSKLGPASSPALSLRILQLVADPSADAAALSQVITADPALAAGLLNVANSVANRGTVEIETVRDAVARLGLAEVGRVAGALSAKSLFNPKLKSERHAFADGFHALYLRAITIATAAGNFAMRVPGARPDRAYLGGMLHDVGRSVALRAVSMLALDGQLAIAPDDPRLARVIDRVHVPLGGEVHQEWQLPQYLTDLAALHHERTVPEGPEFVDLHVVRLVAAVHDLRNDLSVAVRAADEVLQSATALHLRESEVRSIGGELKLAEEHAQKLAGAAK
ncbi:MAG: HDOD domain-containing protein [Deltaproteobacteria bacterium]|nr:HDOD domain-containing protein [Deltaproteobacteria bacterium]